MNTTDPHSPLLTQRILWGALTFSMVIYTGLLLFLQKITHITLPDLSQLGELPLFEYLSLAANLLVFFTLDHYRNHALTKKTYAARQGPLVVCLALNEMIVIMGFVATFISESGNGFYIATNLLVALVANLMMLPKNIQMNSPT